MSDSVVAVIFQIAFHVEIHANNFFYFLKIIFNISTSKRSKKYKLYLILTKINLKFNETQVKTHSQTAQAMKPRQQSPGRVKLENFLYS
jgi:hypothetical protein